MSAKDQIRAMLDELMGTSRNGSSARRSIEFDDPRVCRAYLLGCCPNKILAETRMDLGECRKIHDPALKADYEQALEKRKDLDYEFTALDVLEDFIKESERRKEIAKRKLKETQEELGEEAATKMNIINELGEQIGTKIAKSEEVASQGQVEETMKILEEVEQLKKQKSDLEYEFRNSTPASTFQQQKLRVCEVCSAYLGIHDNDRRLADHFGGKLHLGFIDIREKLDNLRERVRIMREAKQLERRKEREDRDKNRDDRDRNRRRSRSRSNSRQKSSKYSRNRSRSRSTSRSKAKSSSSSSYYKRSDSRDRKYSRRSRSRSPSRRHDKTSYGSKRSSYRRPSRSTSPQKD